jgi:hypothetical protein
MNNLSQEEIDKYKKEADKLYSINLKNGISILSYKPK